MYKKILTATLSLILILPAVALAQQQEKPLPLSLEDCIIKALKNNLNVAIDVLEPELADISVSLASEKFMPKFTFGYNLRNTNSASYSWLEASEQVTTKYNDYSAQVSQLIPIGGSLSITFDGSMTDTNRKFISINPRYGNTLSFSFTQPLLRNMGFRVNRKEIIIAENNRERSENSLNKALQDMIYSVEEAYWNLVYSIENLRVKRQSLKLAQDLLEKNKRAVEIGTMAPIEILSAQSGVATREADILGAEAEVRNNEDQLKTIINLAAELKEAEFIKIVPTDKPAYKKRDISLNEAVAVAVENRPDLNSMRIDLENRELDLSYSKNQLLPDLSLQVSYWSPGISGSQIVYPPGMPFGDPIAIIPGDASEAIKDALNFKYKNWSVGLTLSFPLSNVLSRANYAQAKVNLEKSMLQLKNMEQQIFLEIKKAVRAVHTNFQRVKAYKKARELAQKKLEAEEEKLKVGLSTNYIVLQYQRDLADAQTNELKAIIDYNLSLAFLDKTLGINLKAKNISLSEFLYR